MIPKESVLRKLPTVLNEEQRLRLEALVYSTDIITVSFSTLRAIAAKYAEKFADAPDEDRMSMFLHAWSLIDQFHACRQIIKVLSQGNMGPNQTKFYNESEASHGLRNRMDHLSQNIPNLSRKKGLRFPVYGSLSWFSVGAHRYDADGVIVVETGTTVSIMAGTSPIDVTVMGFPNPVSRPIYFPVCQFDLHAFDYKFDIDQSYVNLQNTVLSTDRKLNEEHGGILIKLSEDSGKPLDELSRGHLINEMTMSLDWAFTK